MEKEKWKSLDFILKLNCKRTLQDYVKVIAELERQARNCYYEEIKMERKQFIQMLLLDVCFVLVKIDVSINTAMPDLNRYEQNAVQEGNGDTVVEETRASLRSVDNNEGACMRSMSAKLTNRHENVVLEMEQCNDGVSCTTVGRNNMENDNDKNFKVRVILISWEIGTAFQPGMIFFLLENRIPFFVIDRIYRFAMDDIMMDTSPADKISECVEDILRQFPIAIEEPNRPKQFHYFLHLCHMYLRPSQKTGEIQENPIRPWFLYRILHFGHNYSSIVHRPKGSHQFKIPVQQKDCFQAAKSVASSSSVT